MARPDTATEVSAAAAASVIQEGYYEVRMLHDQRDLVPAYRLRHAVFAEQLKWVPAADSGLETDAYDEVALHVGLFSPDNELMAYVRLLTAEHRFMMEKEFRCVLGDDFEIRKERDTCELTRFCVSSDARSDIPVGLNRFANATAILFKGLYQVCLDRGIRFAYGITDRTIHRYLIMKGYPYELLGTPKEMPDGVVARGVILDWRNFEAVNAARRPELLAWHRQKSMSFMPRAMATA